MGVSNLFGFVAFGGIFSFLGGNSLAASVMAETRLIYRKEESIERAIWAGLTMMGKLRPHLALNEAEMDQAVGRIAAIVRGDHGDRPKDWFMLMGQLAKACEEKGSAKELLAPTGSTSATRSPPKPGNSALESATSLVSSARSLAGIASIPLKVQHSALLEPVEDNDFRFFMTVAGVFVALSRLRSLSSDGIVEGTEEAALLNVVRKHLDEWDSDANRILADCHTFVDGFNQHYHEQARKADAPEVALSVAAGMWVGWNLFGHRPASDEEMAFVHSVAVSLAEMFVEWWE